IFRIKSHCKSLSRILNFKYNKYNEDFINEVVARLHQEVNNTIAMISRIREDYEQDTPDTIEQFLSDQLSRAHKGFYNISSTFGIEIRAINKNMTKGGLMSIFNDDESEQIIAEEQADWIRGK
ncbi:MAG: hypothetical protein VSS52_001480, partial [Thiotrichaceae bacterium]|nr:hypothetical protein [Thiotrichaceae bacterium]